MLENPDPGEIEKVAAQCKLNIDLIRDALDPFEVPRLETEEDTTYVFTRLPVKNGEQITTTPLLITIGKDYIVTISREQLSFMEAFVQGKGLESTTQRVKLFIKIFFELNQEYNLLLTEISRRVRSQIVALEHIDNKDIIQFVDFERVINDFMSALIPTNTILHNLLSGRHMQLYERDEDLVEDLFLGNNQLIETCRATLKNIVNIRDAYLTIMNQDTNRTVKLLTSLTILLTVPTMISSFIGMNVRIPFSESAMAFFMIIAFTALVVLILFKVFMKKRWL